MAVRNFWSEVNYSGRKTQFAGGPAGKDSWMDIKLYQRDNGGGKDHPVLTIKCRTYGNQLHTYIEAADGDIIDEIITER